MKKYKIQYIDSKICSTGKTTMNVEEFFNWITKNKEDFIVISNTAIINKRAIAFIEITEDE